MWLRSFVRGKCTARSTTPLVLSLAAHWSRLGNVMGLGHSLGTGIVKNSPGDCSRKLRPRASGRPGDVMLLTLVRASRTSYLDR